MKINLYLGVNEPFEKPNLPSSGRVTPQVRGEVTEREALTQSVPGMNHPRIVIGKESHSLAYAFGDQGLPNQKLNREDWIAKNKLSCLPQPVGPAMV